MKLREEGGARNQSTGTTIVIFLSYINDSALRILLKLRNVQFDSDPNADCRHALSPDHLAITSACLQPMRVNVVYLRTCELEAPELRKMEVSKTPV